MSVVKVLSIAGSDPSGGAGIQADLKTISALGGFGCAAMTALTAQNTHGVTDIHVVPTDFLHAQVRTLVSDVQVDAVKIGMLGTADMALAVAEIVADQITAPVVLDPVMMSTSGARLLEQDAVEAMTHLVPLVDVVTPNGPEAGALLGGHSPTTAQEQSAQAQALFEKFGTRVLLKGGHLSGPDAVDIWVDEAGIQRFSAPRVRTVNTHGTGCTLSSAVATRYAQTQDWFRAVADAKDYLTSALTHSPKLTIGSGAGPVHHFHAWW